MCVESSSFVDDFATELNVLKERVHSEKGRLAVREKVRERNRTRKKRGKRKTKCRMRETERKEKERG